MELNTIQSLSSKVEKGATGIHYFMDDEIAEITTVDRKLMEKIRSVAKKHRGIVIDQEPCIDNGGFMLALVPVKLLLAEPKPKTKRQYTPEQIEKRKEQMRKINELRKRH